MCFGCIKRCFCPDPIYPPSQHNPTNHVDSNGQNTTDTDVDENGINIIRNSLTESVIGQIKTFQKLEIATEERAETTPVKKTVKAAAPSIPSVADRPVREQPRFKTGGITEAKKDDAYDDDSDIESDAGSCSEIKNRLASVPNKYGGIDEKRAQAGEQMLVVDNLEENPWYFGAISFYEARSFMEGSKTGTYLVYERPFDQKIPYALLVRFNNQSKNYAIYEEDSTYHIASGFHRDTLEDLIEAYELDKDLSLGLCTALLEPCAKLDKINDLSDDFKDKFEINRGDVEIGAALGKGFSSEVYKGKWKNKDIAVKSLSGNFSKQDFEREVLMLKKLKHRNIVQFYGVSTQDVPYYIILEYMKFGDLGTYLKKQDLEEYQRIHVASQVAEGMRYLAREGVVHRDLAARNVLLREKLAAKISDFGISRLTNTDDVYDATTERKLPIRWLAPECAESKQFSEQSDVWAFSILLMEIYTRRMPYKEFKGNTDDFLDEIKRGYRMKQPDNMPNEIFMLCQECWISMANIRPNFAKISTFFNDYIKARAQLV